MIQCLSRTGPRLTLLCVAVMAAIAVWPAAAWAQRTSTFEQGVMYFPDGNTIDEISTPTPEKCREACLGLPSCQAWLWQRAGDLTHCERLGTSNLQKAPNPNSSNRDLASGRVSAPPGTQLVLPPLFPKPRPGSEITFRIENPNYERYALFKFLNNDADHGTHLGRSAWEGPLSMGDTVQAQYVGYVFDEPDSTTCTRSATDAQLRQIALGAKLSYTHACTRHAPSGQQSSSSITSFERTVLRAERVTVPIGAFEAVVVRKFGRTVHRVVDSSGAEESTTISENESTSWWVPSLGFYVRQQSRQRIVDTQMSQRIIDRYRSGGAPLPPRSTPWNDMPLMIAVRLR